MLNMTRLSTIAAIPLLGLAFVSAGLAGSGWAGGNPPAAATSPAPPESGGDLVSARVVADVEEVIPGRVFHLAVAFEIQPEWHIYWKNPGDSGLATEITVTAPRGFKVGQTRFPRPRSFDDGEYVTYGYEKEAVLFVPITPPKDARPGQVEFQCRIDWLACRKACTMGSAEQTITLKVARAPAPGEASGAGSAKLDPVIARHWKRLPGPLKDLKQSRASFAGQKLTVTGPLPKEGKVSLYPADRPGVSFGPAEITESEGRFHIEVPVKVDKANSLGKPMMIECLLLFGDHDDDPCYRIAIPVEQRQKPEQERS